MFHVLHRRWLAALLALCAGPSLADEPALLLPASLGRTDRVWITGRVLEEAHGRHGPAVVRNARALAAENLEGARVTVRFLGRVGATTSGHDGEFEVEIPAAPGAPFPAGAQPVEVSVDGASATGSVRVVADDAPFIVVSDFDDTVAVTHVESKRKLLANTFLRDAETQEAVAGMAAFYRCLASRGPVAPAFAFVSGSPIQLAPRVERFLEKNGFPPAALYLRNLGPGTLSGYKEPILRTLAGRFPQPLVLVGDSGERDPEIYRQLAQERGDRVRRIYIRRAGEGSPPERFEGTLPFGDPAVAARDAAVQGLAPAGCE
jgi:phosphatidate phosphatase APP1